MTPRKRAVGRLRPVKYRAVNDAVSNAGDAARHDRMVALVDEMLDLHKRLSAAKSDGV